MTEMICDNRRLVIEAWKRLHGEGLMPEAYDQRVGSEFGGKL